ncbi:hypothetical protein [Candidatus Similichlamydia epinepheli]|uniref:hypothetical protein n=1 Tax=Candidatus Similichlamydia epinepheli TaxID=1903953 RepID=UPI0013003027|nr:hypothetical protein [Candidatus Similichlamydia epinepheli]
MPSYTLTNIEPMTSPPSSPTGQRRSGNSSPPPSPRTTRTRASTSSASMEEIAEPSTSSALQRSRDTAISITQTNETRARSSIASESSIVSFVRETFQFRSQRQSQVGRIRRARIARPSTPSSQRNWWLRAALCVGLCITCIWAIATQMNLCTGNGASASQATCWSTLASIIGSGATGAIGMSETLRRFPRSCVTTTLTILFGLTLACAAAMICSVPDYGTAGNFAFIICAAFCLVLLIFFSANSCREEVAPRSSTVEVHYTPRRRASIPASYVLEVTEDPLASIAPRNENTSDPRRRPWIGPGMTESNELSVDNDMFWDSHEHTENSTRSNSLIQETAMASSSIASASLTSSQDNESDSEEEFIL